MATDPTPARFDSLQQEVFLGLWRTYDRLRTIEEELFDSHALTPQQYNALRLLRGVHPGRLQTLDLASRLVSRAPDITRLLDPLEKRGLIDRRRPPERRRVVEVGITEKGLALLRELAEEVRSCHAQQLGHLAPPQLEQLTALLREARRPHEKADSPWLEL